MEDLSHAETVEQEEDDFSDSEVIIKCHSKQELQEQEEKEMQKFIDFMKRNGMVMMQTTPVNQTQSTQVNEQNTTRLHLKTEVRFA